MNRGTVMEKTVWHGAGIPDLNTTEGSQDLNSLKKNGKATVDLEVSREETR